MLRASAAFEQAPALAGGTPGSELAVELVPAFGHSPLNRLIAHDAFSKLHCRSWCQELCVN